MTMSVPAGMAKSLSQATNSALQPATGSLVDAAAEKITEGGGRDPGRG